MASRRYLAYISGNLDDSTGKIARTAKTFRQSQSHKAGRAMVLAGAVLACATPLRPARASEVTSTFTDGASTHLWSNLNNWTPAAEPNNGNGGNDYVVNIPSAPGAATLDVSVTIDGLTLASSAGLNMLDNTSLTISAAATTLTDNGTIVLNSNQAGAPAILAFNGTTLLTGSGTVELNNSATNAQLNTGTGGALTQDTNHSIVGYGEINAALTNNGTVNANVSGQTLLLQTNGMTNNATFEATTSGAVLAINGITVAQGASGQISAATGTTVTLEGGATITDGTLSSAGTGIVQVSGTDTISGVTSSATIDIPDTDTLNVTGNLSNSGVINVNSNSAGAPAILNFNGGTVSGSGSIVMNATTINAQLNGTLTQSLGHTISGYGDINAALTNNGTVNANAIGQVLIVQSSSITNGGTMEATSSGALEFTNAVSVNNAGGQITASGGTVELEDGAAITGGTINAVHPSVVLVPGGSNNATLGYAASFSNLTLSSGTAVDVQDNATLVSSGSTLTDNGTIVINSNQASAPAILKFNGTILLTGSGTVELNDSAINAQLNTGTGGALTQDTNHSIVGFGDINAALTNNGTVNANVNGQTLVLQTNGMTNNATFEATTSGAVLAINGIMVTQGASGQISAATGTKVILEGGATITDGTLSSAGTGIVQVSGTDTISGVTSSATIDISDTDTLNVTGNLSNSGVINVNSNSAGAPAILNFNGGTVSGSGSIVMNATTINAQLNGTLTQSLGHTISGYGDINAALTNNGTVNANVSSQTLLLQTNGMTNNATFEATTSGAVLAINGITVAQGASGQISAATGTTVTLEGGATITDGTLSSAGTGIVQVSGTDTISGVTSSATIDIPDTDTLNVTGNLSNSGVINVNSNSAGAPAILNFNGGTVSGSGSIVMNATTINAQLNGTLTQSLGHTISGYGDINAALTNNGTVNANVSSQTLFLNHSISGTGTLSVASGAELAFAASTGGSSQGAVVIAGSGALDLSNNHLYINYGSNADPVAAIRTYLTTGYNSGNWNGAGIKSSAAAANHSYGIGYADSADTDNPAGLASDQIEIKYTLYGDANLDGVVNGSDFGVLAANFGKQESAWDEGDFNYDGVVNGSDFGLLAANFGQQASGAAVYLPASDWAALDSFASANGLLADVPEPMSASLVVLAGLGVLSARRRSTSRR